MVAGTPHQMEWSVPAEDHSRYCDRNRRIHNRMGGSVSRSENRWALVNGREPDAHKLSRAASSNSGNQIICQGKEKHSHPPDDGQHDSSDIHKQVWGHSLPRAEQTHKRAMVVVPGEYNTTSEPPSGCPQLHSRRRVACDARQIRLFAMPKGIQQDQYQNRATPSGLICLSADPPAQQLCQLETRSRGHGHRCLQLGLDTIDLFVLSRGMRALWSVTSTSGVRSSRFTGAYVWQSTGIMRIFAQRAAQYATVYPFIAVSVEKLNARTSSSKWSQDCSTTKGRYTDAQSQLVFT